MTKPRAAGLVALFLLTLTTPRFAAAQGAASGSYRFVLEDDLVKTVEFDVVSVERNSASGSMTFLDEAKIADVDDVEDPRAPDSAAELFIKASITSMTVEKNRAVMNGVVRDSSHKTYLGRWVQLVVEDNAEDPRIPDRLTWSFCQPQSQGWIPSDADRKDDDGAFLSWWATDADRDDDVGIPSPNLLGNNQKSCTVYPLSSYTFADPAKWEGDIIVRP